MNYNCGSGKSIKVQKLFRITRILTADEERLRRLDLDRLLRFERLRLRERRERFLDFERFERERDRDGDLVRVLRGGTTTGFSLDDKMPMTGSIAAEIIFCASFTMDIASSISRWAASLLFASGLMMDCIEW